MSGPTLLETHKPDESKTTFCLFFFVTGGRLKEFSIKTWWLKGHKRLMD